MADYYFILIKMNTHIKISFLIICLSTCIYSAVYSQSPMGIRPIDTDEYLVLDSAFLSVTYKMTFMPDSMKKNVLLENNYVLLIGKKQSKFFNAYYNQENKETTGQSRPLIDGRGLGGTEVFKNLSEKTMLVTTIVFGGNDVYLYKEKMPLIKWQIGNRKKNIQGYICQDATTTFLGRTYTAWFAPAIPIQNGPWKLGGLPGMILSVSDSKEHFVFECIGIQKSTKKLSIVQYDVKYVDITRANLNRLIRRMHTNFDQYMETQGQIMVKNSQKNISFPYNPIELE